MTHFCGYADFENLSLSESGKLPAIAKIRQLLTGISRNHIYTKSFPGFELGVAIGGAWGESPLMDELGVGYGCVSGDPVYCDQEADLASLAGSIRSVLGAMLGERLSDLSNARGSFSAIAWNPETRTLKLATDKLGTRPCYYRVEGKSVFFSSSERLVRALLRQPNRVDEQGLAEQIFFGQPLGNRTVIEGVRVIRPGEVLIFRGKADIESYSYFDLARVSRLPLDRQETERELHVCFTKAVRRRIKCEAEDAFLSGGMDSRSVVAELLDQGVRVRTFSSSYDGSVDDVVSREVARLFGVEHTASIRSPSERITSAMDTFALYARQHFPPVSGRIARQVWSGDGGSVTLGHVYMDAGRVARAEGHVNSDMVLDLFPNLRRRPSRHISAAKATELSDLALTGAREELELLGSAEPDRRLFLFYMRSDQARHLYNHFELIGQSDIELVTPFFDSDFVSLVAATPISFYLRHELYNSWIQSFRCRAGDVYWQDYPGHIPCHLKKLPGIRNQWDQSWYSSKEVRRAQMELARDLLNKAPALSHEYLRPWLLRLCAILNLIGITRQNHEIAFARNLISVLSAPVPQELTTNGTWL